MSDERFKQRVMVRKLEDLLPEVLIEAQGCDEITALAALRRAVETLCQSHGFGEATLPVTLREKDVEAGRPCAAYLGGHNLLRVLSVTLFVPGREPEASDAWFTHGDRVIIGTSYLPTGKGDIRAEVKAEFMPDVDGRVPDAERFTKWRHLVVAQALADLFAMPKQPWYDATRYLLYADRADRYLEDFLVTEHHYKGDARSPSAAPQNSSGNIFC